MGLPCWVINKAQLSDLNSDNCYFFENYDAIDINQSNIIRLLIADDHYIVRQGLVALLDHESDVKVVAQASNRQEAVTMFRQHQPDVTLMDLRGWSRHHCCDLCGVSQRPDCPADDL
jgi:metal-dependent hydrolase (beta-lactamase superfamily II)